MKKRCMGAALLGMALLLSGCQGKPEEEAAPAPTQEAAYSSAISAQGPVGDAARAVMRPYEEELDEVALWCTDNLTYTIPGDMLNQLALDIEATAAQPQEGYYRFTRREDGNFAYQATVEDVSEVDLQRQTPDPRNETPMDSQMNGDYAVSGGGLFHRSRTYEVREDLTAGRAEISDLLNGEVTGHEKYSFCVREGNLYFVDAVLNLAVNENGVETQGYLCAVGVLRPDSLDVMECEINDLTALPDPATLDWSRYLATARPVTRISAQGHEVSVTP